MTIPSTPATPHENDEPLFDEVVDELGYNPAHPEDPTGDGTHGEPSDPAPSST
jgi:hypothetical protein